MPLVRYHIADDGGVVRYDRMIEGARALGFDAEKAARDAGARARFRPLPFVYVFGRSRFAVSYYGANVFPETISSGLDAPHVRAGVTGKFVMEVREDANHDRTLTIAVELAPARKCAEGDEAAIAAAILAELLRTNSEYAHYVPGARQRPLVTLLAAGDPEYFPKGVKHRYSR